MSITEFLEARIDEDEERATLGWARLGDTRWENNNYGQNFLTPSAVLAECAAKRAIVEHYEDVRESYWQEPEPTTRIAGKAGWLYPFDFLPVLKALAAVYNTHPDYRPEWAL